MQKLTAKIIGVDSNGKRSDYTISNINPDKLNAEGMQQMNTAFRAINSISLNTYADTELTAVYSLTEEVSD